MAKTKGKGIAPLPTDSVFTREVGEQERTQEVLRRMELLADSLGAPAGEQRWLFVAVRLARMHVPELMDARTAHRPKTWTPPLLNELRQAMEKQLAGGVSSQIDAARALVRAPEWSQRVASWADAAVSPAEALVRQYRKARASYEKDRRTFAAIDAKLAAKAASRK
ncbi:MAG: hypothetical protein J0L58_09435 [Burkholderiales bacterium]|nr:hypothetical protein [Burkholderiales bacterium]